MSLAAPWPLRGRTEPFTADRPSKEAKQDVIETFEREYLADLLARCENNVSNE